MKEPLVRRHPRRRSRHHVVPDIPDPTARPARPAVVLVVASPRPVTLVRRALLTAATVRAYPSASAAGPFWRPIALGTHPRGHHAVANWRTGGASRLRSRREVSCSGLDRSCPWARLAAAWRPVGRPTNCRRLAGVGHHGGSTTAPRGAAGLVDLLGPASDAIVFLSRASGAAVP